MKELLYSSQFQFIFSVGQSRYNNDWKIHHQGKVEFDIWQIRCINRKDCILLIWRIFACRHPCLFHRFRHQCRFLRLEGYRNSLPCSEIVKIVVRILRYRSHRNSNRCWMRRQHHLRIIQEWRYKYYLYRKEQIRFIESFHHQLRIPWSQYYKHSHLK